MTKLEPKIKLHFKFPLEYNDHTKVPDDKFIEAKNYFVEKYEGLTITGASVGFWVHSGVEYRDETVEYFVFIEKKKFLRQVKPKLSAHIDKFKKDFEQLEILCYYHDVFAT